MRARLIALFWTANFTILAVWQSGRQRPVWMLFNIALALVGLWFYIEYLIYELKSEKR